MVANERYKSARAFRTAIEERLRQQAQQENSDIMRLRRTVAFERLLARLFSLEEPPWLLKGGYALELRLPGRSRSTKDLDLSIPYPWQMVPTRDAQSMASEAIRERLQEAAAHDLQDWFVYRVGAATSDLDAAPYGGARFPIEALVDARTFARFHVDVGLGDVLVSPPEWLWGVDVGAFAGIAPARVATLPCAQQFAEKLHAYTLLRGSIINTRVKDLIDMLLLLKLGLPDTHLVNEALQATFNRRQTHALPRTLEPPPQSWGAPFTSLADECGLDGVTVEAAFTQLLAFWKELVLAAEEKTPNSDVVS